MNQRAPLPPKPQELPENAGPKGDMRAAREFARPGNPVLRFSPTAWAKVLYFRDRGQSEIGGFGIVRPDDLLRIEEFQSVQQEVSLASISFDDEAVAEFFETQVDLGRRPEQFARVWLHTHPGHSAQPSQTDEETFDRVFGRCQWAVLFVLSRGGQSYSRLRFNIGPGGELLIPVEVDYRLPFGPTAFEAWEAEYQQNVRISPPFGRCERVQTLFDEELWTDRLEPDEWLEEMATMMLPDEDRLIPPRPQEEGARLYEQR